MLELCRAGEGLRVEFKRGLPGDAKVARVLAGLANARGGTLLVGVEDRGRLIGVEHPETTAAELRRIAAERVRPGLAPKVDVLRVEGVELVALRLLRRTGPPHAALDDAGRAEIVLRRGSKTRAAAADELSEGGRDGLPAEQGAALRALEALEARPTPDDLARVLDCGRARARALLERLGREGWIPEFELP